MRPAYPTLRQVVRTMSISGHTARGAGGSEGETVAEEEEDDRYTENRRENNHPQSVMTVHLRNFSQQQDPAADEYEGMNNVRRRPRHLNVSFLTLPFLTNAGLDTAPYTLFRSGRNNLQSAA